MSRAAKATVENLLLSALPKDEYDRLKPQLDPVRLSKGQVLHEAGEQVRNAYFLTSGMVSLLSGTSEGETVQVAMVGSEGIVGLSGIARVNQSPYLAEAQLPSTALRIKTEALRIQSKRAGELQELLCCYAQTLVTQIAQSVVCNLFHQTEQRLARWLLLTHDRGGGKQFALTHEEIAHMLGVSRSGVSTAAGALQRQGLVRYARGRLTVLDRRGLEAAACECYQTIHEDLSCFLNSRA
jgi:CRP-like cAMP-binding protein